MGSMVSPLQVITLIRCLKLTLGVQILKLSVVVTKLGDKPIVGLEKPGQLTDHIWSALMSFCKERPFFTVLCDHTKKFHRHMRRDWRGWIWKSCGCPPGLTDVSTKPWYLTDVHDTREACHPVVPHPRRPPWHVWNSHLENKSQVLKFFLRSKTPTVHESVIVTFKSRSDYI